MPRSEPLLLALVLAAYAGCAAEKPDSEDAVRLPKADPEMKEAIREARRTLDTGLGYLGKPGHRLMLSVRFHTTDGLAEGPWFDEIIRVNDRFSGRVASRVVSTSRLKYGQRAEFSRSDIVDWAAELPDGTRLGGFTDLVHRRRAAATDR